MSENHKPEASRDVPAADENQIVAERRAKLQALRAQGNAFPNDFRRTHLAGDLQAALADNANDELEAAFRR